MNNVNTLLLVAILAMGVFYVNRRPQVVTVVRNPGWGWGWGRPGWRRGWGRGWRRGGGGGHRGGGGGRHRRNV